MPERSWTTLSDSHRAAIEGACKETLSWSFATATRQQVEAIAQFRTEGVKLHDWPDEILVALREAWEEVIAEEVTRNPLLAEAWEGYLRFQDEYGAEQSRSYAK